MSADWLSARFAAVRPRALAALTRQFRDIDMAEEAFAEACLKAVKSWPASGLPADPFAWLLTAARNAGIDRIRKAARRAGAAPDPAASQDTEDDLIARIDETGLRDDVLRLLFICCHPALARQDQLALALKVVAGLSVAEIAQAFLVRPKAMEQRITRAKRTVAAHPVPFDTPGMAERRRRLNEVSLMVYLMFSEGWSASSGEEQIRAPLCAEAIRLGRLLLALFPGMTEVMGLLALMLLQHSRRAARVDAAGALVPLDRQARGLWDREMIAEARVLLAKARRHGQTGPYQLQAEIAEAHAAAESAEATDRDRIEALYAQLARLQPTPVVRLNHAVAVGEARGAGAALALMADLAGPLDGYRWFHTARAAYLAETGRVAEARAAYGRALDLGPTRPERAAILGRIAALREES